MIDIYLLSLDIPASSSFISLNATLDQSVITGGGFALFDVDGNSNGNAILTQFSVSLPANATGGVGFATLPSSTTTLTGTFNSNAPLASDVVLNLITSDTTVTAIATLPAGSTSTPISWTSSGAPGLPHKELRKRLQSLRKAA